MSETIERRLTSRHTSPDRHGIVSARIRPGHAVSVVDVSAGGALIETERRLLPGSSIELQLATTEERAAVRGRVLRCAVGYLCATSVSYRGAIGFDRHLPWYVEEDGSRSGVAATDVRRRAGSGVPITQHPVG